MWAAHTHRTRTQSSMQAASLYLGVRILAGAAGEPCYMASAERPSPGALTWTADSRWGVGGAGYHQQQRGRPRRISMHRLPEVVHGGLLDAGLLVVRVRGREIPSAATRARPDLTIVEAVGGPDGCRSEQAQVLQRRRRDERSTRMLVSTSTVWGEGQKFLDARGGLRGGSRNYTFFPEERNPHM